MRSMTGFGVGEAPLCTDEASGAQGRLSVEIRAVNHRFLDVRVRGPSQIPDLTTAVETLARERLTRGRFDVNVRIDGAALGAMVIDRERARSVFRSLAELRDELAPGDPLPLSVLGAVPDLFVPKLEHEIDKLRAALAAAFEAALESLDAMRLREGLALGDDLCRRLVAMRKLSKSISERSPQTLESYKKRLKER